MPQFKTLLVCESTPGGTDKRLLEELIKKHSLLQDASYEIKTIPPGGIEDVKGFLKNALINRSDIVSREIKTVLVIVDGDNNPRKRFKEMKRCFDASKIFQIQRVINSSLPKSSTKINVGIYLFPDCLNPGSLETLCLKTIKHNKLIHKLNCVNQYMTCISNLEGRMSENNKSKSKFRIFLATPNPDRYIDNIINHTNFNSKEFNPLKKFIRQAR